MNKLKVNADGTVTYRMKAGKDIVVASMPYRKALKLAKDPNYEFELEPKLEPKKERKVIHEK